MVIVTATVSYVLTFNMASQSWKECRIEKPFYVYNQVFYYNEYIYEYIYIYIQRDSNHKKDKHF